MRFTVDAGVYLVDGRILSIVKCFVILIAGYQVERIMARRVHPYPHDRKVIVTEVTVKNFRCFSSIQSVPLAPLTFLVGENSTGKTSMLALVRVLWDMAFRHRPPIFNEPPFDLGGFDEIAFKDATRQKPKAIEAGIGVTTDFFELASKGATDNEINTSDVLWRYKGSFKKQGDIPSLSTLAFSQGEYKIEERFKDDMLDELYLKSPKNEQVVPIGNQSSMAMSVSEVLHAPDFYLFVLDDLRDKRRDNDIGSPKSPVLDKKFLREMRKFIDPSPFSDFIRLIPEEAAYATSPVRSKPLRTYHATNYPTDPEGNFVPFYLANVHSRAGKDWKSIQQQLEALGQEMGIFDSLSIEKTTELDGSPFQIHVKMPGVNDTRELNRSLVDVGYGVSQALPIMVSLLDRKSAPLTLLQQPEIHLHPKAQAAMADVLCKFVQSAKGQLMVETHSDYIVERVRIRIKEEKLDPSMVVVLFFERTESGVQIHPIRFDHLGNVVDAPPSYREFFLDEMDRSMGLD